MPLLANSTFQSNAVISATGEKIAFSGQIYTPDRGSKSISRVQWRWGPITKAGGSALTVSLQDALLNTGSFPRPDETQDQTVAVANADAGFISNAWYRSGVLSANRSVNYGDWLSVVWEYDGGGRLGSDSVVVSTAVPFNVMGTMGVPCFARKSAGAWSTTNDRLPNVLLEFSDGTFGRLVGGTAQSGVGSHSYAVNTVGADEYGIVIPITFNCRVDGVWVSYSPAGSSSDANIVLYSGTTAIGTISLDANHHPTSAMVSFYPFSSEISLTAGTTYYLALQPTTANTLSLSYLEVADNAHFQAWTGGSNVYQASRVDAGAWSTLNTRRPLIGLSLSAIDAGGTAGGVVKLAGNGGGLAG